MLLTGSLQVFGQLAHDECVAAMAITGITAPITVGVDMTQATESMDASCEAAGDNNLDVWYTFTMPVNGNLRFTAVSIVERITLFDSCGGSELACFSGNNFVNNLDSGTVYTLRYATPAPYATPNNSFVIQAFPPPINDDCQDALEIVGIAIQQIIYPDNRGANESLDASCDNNAENNLDMWYWFEMPYDGKVKISGISIVERVTLYDSCAGSEIICLPAGGFIKDLDSGVVYLLRYATNSAYAGTYNLNIQAFPRPVNDDCSAAIVLPGISNLQSITLDNRGASESLTASCEMVSEDNLDLWYTFTMPFYGKVKVDGLWTVHQAVLFDSCGGNEVDCLPGGGFFHHLDSGKTYSLRYASASQFAIQNTITVQAFSVPQNDDCSEALTIPNIELAQLVSLDTREASESLDASCEDPAQNNLDLWYTFTMPFNGQVEVSGVFGVNRLVLFDSCGGNELNCLIGNGFFPQLTGGTTYLLRYAAITANANTDQFTIQAFPAVPNDRCEDAFAIEKVDSLQFIPTDTREATESIRATCDLPGVESLDLWYHFTMPFDGTISLSSVNNAHRISLWDSCGGMEIFCLAGSGMITGLSKDTVYWLRYSAPESNAAEDSFSIEAIMELGVEAPWASGINIYPNPADDILYIESPEIQTGSLEIMDFSGRMVRSSHHAPSLTKVDISSLPGGIYSVKFQTDKGMGFRKIVVR